MAIDSGFKIAVCDDTEKDRLKIVLMTEKMLQETVSVVTKMVLRLSQISKKVQNFSFFFSML